MHELSVIPAWCDQSPVTEAEIRRRLDAERLAPYRWSNGPHDTYAPHRHPYDKVLVVAAGSITFDVDGHGQVALSAGDRLNLPAGLLHSAVVGPEGVVCLEAWRERATG